LFPRRGKQPEPGAGAPGRDQSEEDEPPLPELGFVPPDPVLLENGLRRDGHPDKACTHTAGS
jgi:hypothetical protein